MSKKKISLIIVCSIVIILFVVIYLLINKSKDDTADIFSSVRNSPAATLEFVDDADKGYKLFTSEIATLWTFDSLCIEPSEEAFSGDWIYRLVFNPKSYVRNGNEIEILFGEKNISVNGQTYKAEDGVDYQDILNWAAYKYKYYDYDLMS